MIGRRGFDRRCCALVALVALLAWVSAGDAHAQPQSQRAQSQRAQSRQAQSQHESDRATASDGRRSTGGNRRSPSGETPTRTAVASVRASARAEAERHLATGRELYLQLDFPGAIEAMSRALAVSGAGAGQRLEAHEYRGASYLVMNDDSSAREAFGQMLRIDPYHALREPSGSPKIRSFVEGLRAEMVPDAALDPDAVFTAELPEAGRAGDTIAVRVTSAGISPTRVDVLHRSDEQRDWSRSALERRGEAHEGSVPAPATTGRLLLYAEARDKSGRVVGRAGEPHWPLEVAIRDELPQPLVRRWWLWTLVGVAVVGATVGLGVVLTQPERAPAGSLGRVELP